MVNERHEGQSSSVAHSETAASGSSLAESSARQDDTRVGKAKKWNPIRLVGQWRRDLRVIWRGKRPMPTDTTSHPSVAVDVETPPRQPLHINEFPPEILQRIFLFYVRLPTPSDEFNYWIIDQKSLNGPGHGASPILLGQVCTYWRHVSTMTPTLWSTIHIPPHIQVHSLPLVHYWFAQSREEPLDVTLSLPVPSGKESDADKALGAELFATVLSYRGRWRRIHLYCPGGNYEIPELITSKTIPFLERFDLSLPQWSVEKSVRLSRLLISCPTVTEAHFGKDCNDFRVIEAAPSLPTLRSLHLSIIDGSKLLSVLSSCAALEELVVPMMHGVVGKAKERLLVPKLKSMTLGFVLWQAELWFDRLLLPSLEVLQLKEGLGREEDYDTGWLSLESLLVNSGCRLQSFACRANTELGAGESNILPALRLPSLSHLIDLTISSKVTDAMLNSLLEQPLPLPNLRRLTFDSCYSTDGVLSAVVASRKDTLKYLHAGLWGPAFSRDLASTRENPEVDMNLVWVSSTQWQV